MANEHASLLQHFAYTTILGGLTIQLLGERPMDDKELVKFKNLAFRGSYPSTSLALLGVFL